jgi:hypothetical protein
MMGDSAPSGERCHVLFLTQAFPRNADDLMGAFLLHLGQRLAVQKVELSP